MSEWVRIKTRFEGRPVENDWHVYRDGYPVGRVSMEKFPYNDAKPWCWFKQIGLGVHGRENSLPEALEALRKAVIDANDQLS